MNEKFTSAFKCWAGKAALVSALACPAMLVSCGDDYDDTELRQQIENLDTRLKALEDKVNSEISTVKGLITSLDSKVGNLITVDKVVEADGVYTIALSNGSTLSINKNNPSISPVTVMEVDGVKCWGMIKNGTEEVLKDAKGQAIPVSVTIPPTVRINSDTKEYEISADGGTTWQSTGMKAEGTQPSIFTKLEEDANSVTFTLADGTKVVVAKTTDFQCKMLAGKQFFTAGESKAVLIEMNKVSKYIITKPEGWKASIAGNKLNITAPATTNANSESKGKVSVMAVSEDGKSIISEVAVEVGTPSFTIAWQGGDEIVVTLDPKYADNNDYLGYYIGACNLKEFNPQAIVSKLDGYAEYNSPVTYSLKKLLGSEPVKGESYVVWAIDAVDTYMGGTYDASNLIFSTLVGKTATIEWGEITFENASATVDVKGAEVFYAALIDKTWTNDSEKATVLAEFVEYELNSGSCMKHMATSFNGSMYQLAGSTPKAGESYLLVIVPQDTEKEEASPRGGMIGSYTAEDLFTAELEMPGYTTGGTTTTTIELTEIGMTDIKATFKPSSDSYKTFYNYYTEEKIGQYANDEEIIDALMNGWWSKSGADEFEWQQTGLTPGEKGYFVAISINKEGKIGQLNKTEATTKELSFLDATVTAECIEIGATTATIKFTASSTDIVKYRYFYQPKSNFDYWPLQGDESKAESLLVLDEYYGNEETEDATLELTDLDMDYEYHLFVIGLNAEGGATKVTKVTFTPTLKVDWVSRDDAAWDGMKPTFNVTITEVDTYPAYEVSMDLTPAANCEKYYVWYGDKDYLPGFSSQRNSKIVAEGKEHTGAVTGLIVKSWTYMFSDVIGIVSVDKDGKYYAAYIIDPKTGEEVSFD